MGCPEAHLDEAARQRIFSAQETDTITTRLYDQALAAPWPERYVARVLANPFNQAWAGHEIQLASNAESTKMLAKDVKNKNYDVAPIYAGQSIAFVDRMRPAAELTTALMEDAWTWFVHRAQALSSPASSSQSAKTPSRANENP